MDLRGLSPRLVLGLPVSRVSFRVKRLCFLVVQLVQRPCRWLWLWPITMSAQYKSLFQYLINDFAPDIIYP